jgi:maleylpyruvate isomerase
MPPDRRRVEPWLRVETTRMLATVETFWDRDLTEDSLLPGWSWGHLLTHLARNADALGNLLSWARTGVETPMYRSKQQRDDDINVGATRPGGVLLSDVADSAARLRSAAELLAPSDWDSDVVTAQGRTIPAAQVPWLRLREVAIHHVDLGASFEDLPRELAAALLDDVLMSLRTKPGWPSLQIEQTDGGHAATVGDGPTTHVKGTGAQLLGWLTGRREGGELVRSSAALPPLPAWL